VGLSASRFMIGAEMQKIAT